ncbi:response regulator [Oceanispirochaeta sp.]|jgi:two-component system response regulator YesN|uniref:response regulator n=1 Tax=Oceanispirochaeta sp. TaxID=2035350 RepID=UPI00263244D1|nr:response regulator [Oceanispirochaeta sp.]MDA3958368.1 response regulator [Oceanispirochaeta sp.]
MYKMIFVDDEAIVREGISSCVPWDEVGFQLVGVFEHGLDALEYIKNNPVDLVLSDINMPRMSGLELSRVLGEKFPDIIIILLTGYDDFEYAQEAIRNQVREFILKPITRNELSTVLSTIRKELDLERSSRLQQDMLKAKLDQSFPLLKERFLCRLISDSVSIDKLQDRKAFFQWTDLESLYQVVILKIPSSWSELERFSLGEFLKGLVKDVDEVFFSRMEDIIFLIQESRQDRFKAYTTMLAQEAFNFASSLDKPMISIGCGEVVDGIPLLERSYQGACTAVDYSRSLGLSQVVTVEEIRNREAPSPEKLNQYTSEMMNHIKDGRARDSIKILRELIEYLETHYQTPQQLSSIFLQLYSSISLFIRDLELVSPEGILGSLNPSHFEALTTAEKAIESLILNIDEQIRQRRKGVLLSRIDRAKSIIQERFIDKDFSLNDICLELYLSTSQFSLLFKEGTDMTFVEYLTFVRMEEAKQLLWSSDLKSYEIAEQVGFSDPRYFSIIFKKHTGMTAMEYRRTRTQ